MSDPRKPASSDTQEASSPSKTSHLFQGRKPAERGGALTRERIAEHMEAFRKGAQMKFLRRESEIYKTVYLEVSDAVKQYCEYYEITLVIRFNREPLETASSPQDVLSRLNKQVVFNRPEDDITTAVLDYLNREYEKSAGRGASPVRTTGAER